MRRKAAVTSPPRRRRAWTNKTEFAIACYADGTLERAKRAGVEQLLASDGRARALLDEYENVDATAKAAAYSAPFPAVNWDQLAADLSEATATNAAAVLPEAFEREIAAYAEGAISPGEQDEIEARLASDPAARVALSEYQNLDAALRAMPAAAPVPLVDWDRLAGRISAPWVLFIAAASEAEASGEGPGNPVVFPDLVVAPFPGPPGRGGVGAPRGGPGRRPSAALRRRGRRNRRSRLLTRMWPAEAGRGAGGGRRGGADRPAEGISPGRRGRGSDDGVVSSPPRAFVASGLPTPQETDVLPAMPF